MSTPRRAPRPRCQGDGAEGSQPVQERQKEVWRTALVWDPGPQEEPAVCLHLCSEGRSGPSPCAQAWASAPGALGVERKTLTPHPPPPPKPSLSAPTACKDTTSPGHTVVASAGAQAACGRPCVLLVKVLRPPPPAETPTHSSFTMVSLALPLNGSQTPCCLPPPSLPGLPGPRSHPPWQHPHAESLLSPTLAFLPLTHSFCLSPGRWLCAQFVEWKFCACSEKQLQAALLSWRKERI